MVSSMSPDPKALVSLSRVAGLVSEFFDLEDPVEYDTPFVWWDRSKRNIGIALPMPEPIGHTNEGNRRGPIWQQQQIIHWYGEWRGLDVPFCIEAGDRTTNRGASIPSPYRVS